MVANLSFECTLVKSDIFFIDDFKDLKIDTFIIHKKFLLLFHFRYKKNPIVFMKIVLTLGSILILCTAYLNRRAYIWGPGGSGILKSCLKKKNVLKLFLPLARK